MIDKSLLEGGDGIFSILIQLFPNWVVTLDSDVFGRMVDLLKKSSLGYAALFASEGNRWRFFANFFSLRERPHRLVLAQIILIVRRVLQISIAKVMVVLSL